MKIKNSNSKRNARKTLRLMKIGRTISLALLFIVCTVIAYLSNQMHVYAPSIEIEETDVIHYDTIDVDSTSNFTAISNELPVVCSTAYMEETEYPECIKYQKMMYTTESVQLRKRPTKNSDSIMILPKYQVVVAQISNEENDWYFVTWTDENGDAGWIRSEYLTDYKNEYVDIPLEFYHQDLVNDTIELLSLDIDEYFIYGMMYTENRFSNLEESCAGAKGILQIMPTTWDDVYPKFCEEYPEWSWIENDVNNKTSNIVIGMYYVKYIQDSYNMTSVKNNSSKILTSYNRGNDGAKDYYKRHGTYSSSYSKEILRAAEYIRTNKTWKEGM